MTDEELLILIKIAQIISISSQNDQNENNEQSNFHSIMKLNHKL